MSSDAKTTRPSQGGPRRSRLSGPDGGARGEVLLLTHDGSDGDGVGPVLREAGYEVDVAVPDSETLDRAIAAPPALVIVDLVPDDGPMIGFVYCLESELSDHAPPVLALAAEDGESAIERAFEAGVRDVLSKPVPPSLLRVKVGRTARKRSPLPRRFGRYEIERVLGRGAMGTVYLARRDDGHEVALKVLAAGARGLDAEALARFRREADVLRSLRGSSIPRWLDAGRIDDHFYCAMELIPGDTLASIVDLGPLPAEATARMLDEVAATLVAIHDAGLVHRDVKPANVIVTPDGRSRLVDFGLAKAIGDASLTRPNEILGTAPYMAPELIRDGVTNALTDAFALGVTGLEALLGRCPLVGSDHEVAARLMRGDVPRPRELLPEGHPELLVLIEGLLAVEPGSRLGLRDARVLLRARGSFDLPPLVSSDVTAEPVPGRRAGGSRRLSAVTV